METVQTYPKGLDFEQVKAALMKDRERLREIDRQMKDTIRNIY